MGRPLPAIRPARADDASFIARNILASQRGPLPRGWFDIALGWPEPQCLAFVERIAVCATAVVVARLAIHHRRGGRRSRPLRCAPCRLTGTSPAARAAIAAAAAESGLSASDLAAIFERGAYTRNCWVQGGEGDWLIEHVATLPEYRGHGLMQALIDHALAAGRAAGFERASISFLIGNAAAERCYAKAGFAFAEEKRDPAFEAITGAPGFRRFARAM